MPAWRSAGIGLEMRLLLLFWLMMAGCLGAAPFHWPWSTPAGEQKTEKHFRLPWNSRTTEQTRLNAATAPKPTSREEQVMTIDRTKEFNPSSANFGSGRSVSGKKMATGEFHFVDRTRTKSFETRGFATKEATGMNSQYATKTAETKESWFARRTALTKAYATRENTDANKNLEGRALPGSEKKFIARGRRQADLDKNGAAGQALGADRDGGQSWTGEVRPLTIQDVRTLLNKN